MRISGLLHASFLCLSLGATMAVAQPAQQQGDPMGMNQLHNDLRLSGSQEDAWRNFQQAYAMDPQEMQRQQSMAANMARMTAPQRVDMALDMQKAELAAQERRGQALKAFYSTLSPQQRQTFDRETLPPQGQE